MSLSFSLEDVPKVVEEVDIIYSESGDDFCYTLKKGPYKGLSFVYADLKFTDTESGDIQVDYMPMILNNEFNIEVDQDLFSEYAGQILSKVINAAIQEHIDEHKDS